VNTGTCGKSKYHRKESPEISQKLEVFLKSDVTILKIHI
jgi:hypothetical protein